MNPTPASGLPPLPPEFGADDGWGALIAHASSAAFDAAFDAYVAASRLVRLLDPAHAARRVVWPAGQPPFAVPDLAPEVQPAIAFLREPEAAPRTPFALVGHFGESAGSRAGRVRVTAHARDCHASRCAQGSARWASGP